MSQHEAASGDAGQDATGQSFLTAQLAEGPEGAKGGDYGGYGGYGEDGHYARENGRTGDAGEPGEAGGADDAALQQVPDSADGYELAFAEDVTVDHSLLENFKATAFELGMPLGQAQKLADFYVQNMTESARAAQEAHREALLDAKRGWEMEIRSRPAFRRETADASKTLKEFGSPELSAIMDQTMLGSHPVFFDFMARVGRALAEPESRSRGGNTRQELPLMDRLWPDKK